jgi:hypothetical protein
LLNSVKVVFVEGAWTLNSYFLVTIPPKSAFLQGWKNSRTFAPGKRNRCKIIKNNNNEKD